MEDGKIKGIKCLADGNPTTLPGIIYPVGVVSKLTAELQDIINKLNVNFAILDGMSLTQSNDATKHLLNTMENYSKYQDY